MKKQATKKAKVTYQAIEKNIYKTGRSYRVRVGAVSEYCSTLLEARKAKKFWKNFGKTNESVY